MQKAILNQKISKDMIEGLKNSTKSLAFFLQNRKDRQIIFLLQKLGRLENGYSKKPLLNLLNNKNEEIRSLAIKNLAKLNDFSLLPIFKKLAEEDESTVVRRESVSAIGRLRDEQIIPVLFYFLKDNDPKVAMQAIRGLIIFSKKPLVKKELKKMMAHPNEQIKEIIKKITENPESKKISPQKQTEILNQLKNVVVEGDVEQIIKCIPDESIHLTFTSPPYYNARDYSIYQSYNAYLKFLERVFKQVYRVTKEGRFFVLNTSPIIIPRISRAHSSKRYPIPYDVHPLLVKMGWEFIDDIVWLKPEASVKNRNAGFLQHRKPLAYKPNAVTEMLMVYRKKTDKLLDWNMKQYNWDVIKESKILGEYETTNVWHIDPVFDKIHSAVFPIELCNRVINFYSFVGDLIFDPFAGSGTLGKSALNLKRRFFLTEKESKYITRIKEEFGKNYGLFNPQNILPKFINLEDFKKSFKN